MWVTGGCLVLAVLVSACGDPFFQDERPPHASHITLTYEVPSGTAHGSGGTAEAFHAVDEAYLQIRLDPDHAVHHEERVPVSPADGRIRLELLLELEDGRSTGELLVELRHQGDPLFTGGGAAVLDPGGTSRVDVELAPVVSDVVIQRDSPDVPTLVQLGATMQFQGHAIYASGHRVDGASVSWRSLTPSTVSVTGDGVAEAMAPGIGWVEASSEDHRDSIQVHVDPEVESVRLDPATMELLPGERGEIRATVLDPGGSELPNPVTWQSSDPGVAEVDSLGGVTAGIPGEATVTASVGSTQGTVQVVVGAQPPTLRTVGATAITFHGARLRAEINPMGLESELWFEWGTSAELEDARSTSPEVIEEGTQTLLRGVEIEGLEEAATVYFRPIASNAAGQSVGEVRSFTTTVELPVPADLRVELFQGEGLQASWGYDVGRLDDTEFELTYRRDEPGQDWTLLSRTMETSVTREEDLTAGISYQFRVRACRLGECSGWSPELTVNPVGSDVQVETLPVRQEEGVVQLAAEISDGGFQGTYRFYWSTDPDMEGGEFTPEREVPRAALLDDEPSGMSHGSQVGSQVHLVEEVLEGLEAGQTYYVLPLAEAQGQVVSGDVAMFIAGEPPPAVGDLSLTQGPFQASGIEVSWTYGEDPEGFELEARDGPAASWQPLVSLDGWERSYTRGSERLERDVEYGFRVRACSLAGGCSEPVEESLVLEERFLQVVTLPAQEITPFRAELHGEVGTEGMPGVFRFQVGQEPDLSDAILTPATEIATDAGDMESVAQVVELPEDGTTYYFRLWAENEAGEAVGEVLSFETPVHTPIPTALDVSAGFPGTTAGWSYPYEDALFTLEGRSITQGGDWVSLAQTELTNLSFSENLPGGEQYEFRVQGCRSGICSEWSESVELTVPQERVLPALSFQQTADPVRIPQESGQDLDVLWITEGDVSNGWSFPVTNVRALLMYIEVADAFDGPEPTEDDWVPIPWLDAQNLFGVDAPGVLTPVATGADVDLRLPLEPLVTDAQPLAGSGMEMGSSPGSILITETLDGGETVPTEVNFLVAEEIDWLRFRITLVGRLESTPLDEFVATPP